MEQTTVATAETLFSGLVNSETKMLCAATALAHFGDDPFQSRELHAEVLRRLGSPPGKLQAKPFRFCQDLKDVVFTSTATPEGTEICQALPGVSEQALALCGLGMRWALRPEHSHLVLGNILGRVRIGRTEGQAPIRRLRLLNELVRKPGERQTHNDLSERLGIHPRVIGAHIKALALHGIVKFHPGNKKRGGITAAEIEPRAVEPITALCNVFSNLPLALTHENAQIALSILDDTPSLVYLMHKASSPSESPPDKNLPTPKKAKRPIGDLLLQLVEKQGEVSADEATRLLYEAGHPRSESIVGSTLQRLAAAGDLETIDPSYDRTPPRRRRYRPPYGNSVGPHSLLQIVNSEAKMVCVATAIDTFGGKLFSGSNLHAAVMGRQEAPPGWDFSTYGPFQYCQSLGGLVFQAVGYGSRAPCRLIPGMEERVLAHCGLGMEWALRYPHLSLDKILGQGPLIRIQLFSYLLRHQGRQPNVEIAAKLRCREQTLRHGIEVLNRRGVLQYHPGAARRYQSTTELHPDFVEPARDLCARFLNRSAVTSPANAERAREIIGNKEHVQLLLTKARRFSTSATRRVSDGEASLADALLATIRELGEVSVGQAVAESAVALGHVFHRHTIYAALTSLKNQGILRVTARDVPGHRAVFFFGLARPTGA